MKQVTYLRLATRGRTKRFRLILRGRVIRTEFAKRSSVKSPIAADWGWKVVHNINKERQMQFRGKKVNNYSYNFYLWDWSLDFCFFLSSLTHIVIPNLHLRRVAEVRFVFLPHGMKLQMFGYNVQLTFSSKSNMTAENLAAQQ